MQDVGSSAWLGSFFIVQRSAAIGDNDRRIVRAQHRMLIEMKVGAFDFLFGEIDADACKVEQSFAIPTDKNGLLAIDGRHDFENVRRDATLR